MVLGLGNPGETYSETRHNVGFWVVDRLSSDLDIRLKKPPFKSYQVGRGKRGENLIFLSKPLTYMNRSGEVVHSLLHYSNLSPSSLLVICDTLDLPPGRLRLRKKGSSAGHNGLKSIIACLGTQEFMRLYIGIGRPADPSQVVSYVLGKPSKEEKVFLDEAVALAAKAVVRVLEQGPEVVMNEINRKA